MADGPVFQELGCRPPTREEVRGWSVFLAHHCVIAAGGLGQQVRPLGQSLFSLSLQFLRWRGWVDIVVLAFLAGLALYFFRDAVFSNRIYYENDTAAFYYPLTGRFDRALSEGALPLWTRGIFAGYPLYADGETGVFSLINLLLFNLLPLWQAFIWRRVLTFVLASWLMYGFGRAMGFRPFGASLAGVVFSYGSFFVAQMHHSNVVGSAIWLPLIFLAVELALKSTGFRRFQWLVIGGIALGGQSVTVHIQVVAMTLLALALYLAYRALLGPVSVRLRGLPPNAPSTLARKLLVANANVWGTLLQRAGAVVAAAALVVLLGLGLGAVQLLPLYELAQFSFRSSGVPYAFASTYSMQPLGVLQLLLPSLFRDPLGGPWALGAGWETTMYLGIPALIFAVIGVFFARNRYTFFFFGLALLSAALALGPNSPANLHYLLWEVPGFSFLRAPGRFSLLVIFAGAALAGWGAHWLDMRLSTKLPVGGDRRGMHLWRSGWFSLFLAFTSLLPLMGVFALITGNSWLGAHKADTLDLLVQQQLIESSDSTPAGLERAYQGLLWAFNLFNPATAATVVLLFVTTALLLLWYGAPRLGHLAKGALLGVLVVDLFAFGAGYHPQISYTGLTTPSGAISFLEGATQGNRALNRSRLRMLEENRLLPFGVQVLNGYSSLPPQRLLEFLGPLRTAQDNYPDILVDTASIQYIARDAKFIALPSYKLVSFDPGGPITQGISSNPGASITLDGQLAQGNTLGVVSALRSGTDVPDNSPVAELIITTVSGDRLTQLLWAGKHTSEWAYDRSDVRPQVRHAQAEKAFTFKNTDMDGRVYDASLYYAELPLGKAVTAKSVELHGLCTTCSLRLYGLSLFDSKTGAFTQLRSKTKYRIVYKDDDVIVYENASPLPRAYVVGAAIERAADPKILVDMLEGSFNPRQAVILEDPTRAGFPRDLMAAERPPGLAAQKPFFAKAQLAAYDAASASISYTAPEAGYLVLTDAYYPGWRATIDGQPTPIYRANYLFRAVHVPSGSHQVEFHFDPPSMRLGLGITLMSAVLASLVLLLPGVWLLIGILATLLARWRAGSITVE